jgi:small subunit ribosomal protein S15
MAKLHTKKKGKAGARKVKGSQKWVDLSSEEIEKLVIDLRKAGNTASKIGHVLRDQYGIGSVQIIAGKSITEIIENSMGKPDYPDDILNLIKKAVNLRKHLERHRSDVHNKTKLHNVEAKIRRIGSYYTRTGKLPTDWSYDPSKAALLVK